MNAGVLAAGIWPSVTVLRNATAPLIERYAWPLDLNRPFRFVVGDTSTDDGETVITPANGGGNWIAVRADDRGADITATGTVVVGGGRWRVIPATPLTGNIVVTLGTTNAEAGDQLEFTRLDVAAHTVTFLNGGTGGGTLVVMPVSARARFVACFDGTDWVERDSHLML